MSDDRPAMRDDQTPDDDATVAPGRATEPDGDETVVVQRPLDDDRTVVVDRSEPDDATRVVDRAAPDDATRVVGRVELDDATRVVDRDTPGDETVVVDRAEPDDATRVVDRGAPDDATVVVDRDTPDDATRVVDRPAVSRRDLRASQGDPAASSGDETIVGGEKRKRPKRSPRARRRQITLPPGEALSDRIAVPAVGPGAVTQYSPRRRPTTPPAFPAPEGEEPSRGAETVPSVQRGTRRGGMLALGALVAAIVVSVTGLVAVVLELIAL